MLFIFFFKLSLLLCSVFWKLKAVQPLLCGYDSRSDKAEMLLRHLQEVQDVILGFSSYQIQSKIKKNPENLDLSSKISFLIDLDDHRSTSIQQGFVFMVCLTEAYHLALKSESVKWLSTCLIVMDCRPTYV